MKKLLVMVIAMLLVLPLVAKAAVEGDSCDPTKAQCIVIPTEDDINIPDEEHDDVTGTTTKKFPVYLQQPTEKEVKGVVISIKSKSADVDTITFAEEDAQDPYTVTADGNNKFTFSLKEGATAKKDTKILLGYVTEIFKTEGTDCSFKFQQRIITEVPTGAFVSYVAIAAGAVLIGAIYVTTRNKKKLYNI